VAVHRGVRVQREAVLHGEPTSAVTGRRHLGQAQALLYGALLQRLVLVLRPRNLEFRPVLLRCAQDASQNAGDVFVTGRGHRHHRPVFLPQRLGCEEVEVGSEPSSRTCSLAALWAGACRPRSGATWPSTHWSKLCTLGLKLVASCITVIAARSARQFDTPSASQRQA
jgi:hypothetical protein